MKEISLTNYPEINYHICSLHKSLKSLDFLKVKGKNAKNK